MSKTTYKTKYRVLDDTYGRIRRFWYTSDIRFSTREDAEAHGAELVKNPNIDAYKVEECKA